MNVTHVKNDFRFYHRGGKKQKDEKGSPGFGSAGTAWKKGEG